MTRPYPNLPTNVGPCVLWFAEISWDSIAGTDRQIVEAADRPVVWVDAPTPPHRPGGPLLPAPVRGVETVRLDPLLVRIQPFVFPMSGRRLMSRLSASVVVAQTKSTLRRIGATPVAVVAHPSLYLGRWGTGVLEVLYGTDDYEAGSELMGTSPAWLRVLTTKSIREADVSVAVTPALAEKWRELGAQPVVLPNGCRIPDMTSAAGLRAAPRDGRIPTVGLVGHLSARIDMDLIEAIAASEYQLVLAGPYDDRWEPARWRRLTRRENVEYLGVLPSSEMPALLSRVDVGITPYTDSEFNQASFPLKTLEYLSSGLPVVATDLPASRWLAEDMRKKLPWVSVQDHLAIASTQTDFVSEVGRLVRANEPDHAAQRQEYASQHSWQSRWSALMGLIEEPTREARLARG